MLLPSKSETKESFFPEIALATQVGSPYFTTGQMFHVIPVYMCSTVIVTMHQLMGKDGIRLKLKVNVVLTEDNLQ